MRGFFNLSERHQDAYTKLVDAIREMKANVRVPLRDGDEYLEIYKVIRYDFPELDVIWDYSQSGYYLNNIGNLAVDMNILLKYYGTREEMNYKMQVIDQEIEKIIEESLGGRRMSDEKCMEEIYRTMVKKLKYSKPLADGSYPAYAYTLECLLHGEGVCAGMACVYTYIMRNLQIPATIVIGYANGGDGRGKHAWNIVQMLDGSYRHMDVTWDLSKNSNRYMALDDLAMRARRHQWDTLNYPLCS